MVSLIDTGTMQPSSYVPTFWRAEPDPIEEQ